jgi:hypothetical protein
VWLDALAEPLAARGTRPGDGVKRRVGEAPARVFEVRPTVGNIGRRCSNQDRLVVSVKPLVVSVLPHVVSVEQSVVPGSPLVFERTPLGIRAQRRDMSSLLRVSDDGRRCA